MKFLQICSSFSLHEKIFTIPGLLLFYNKHLILLFMSKVFVQCLVLNKRQIISSPLAVSTLNFDRLASTKHQLRKVYWSTTMWGNNNIKCFLSLFLFLYSIYHKTKSFVACCLIGLQYYGITNTRTKCSKFYVQNSLANLDRGQNSTWLYEMKTFKFSWCPAYKFKRVHCELKVHAAT